VIDPTGAQSRNTKRFIKWTIVIAAITLTGGMLAVELAGLSFATGATAGSIVGGIAGETSDWEASEATWTSSAEAVASRVPTVSGVGGIGGIGGIIIVPLSGPSETAKARIDTCVSKCYEGAKTKTNEAARACARLCANK
jgi:hypothetical protein